eukprot:CAMPEP_0197465450 /NCGR_PEP_ID=MMETSP1175-20131217/64544_1 /TAXON_ID=1003142 /ORGANISM="Triceratium dubium, Strain CCMP147" /LENGTH=285 /DNA_ID=CAMNT_0043001465 /DNA_START=74 /DNA_END=930 /DNA_ORIENTATION=+
MKLAVAAIVVFSTSAKLVSGDSGGLRQMQTCPQNEVYKTCASSCPETCDNYGQPIRCNKRCAPAGCFCDNGFVREDDAPGSACIPPSNCPPKCPANEVYQTCGTACPATCSTKDAIRPCIAMCVQGCFCEDGYVRDDDTDALRPFGGLPASSCPETCDNYGQPIACDRKCAPAGCFCEEGYVREDDTPGSACILPTNCPLTTCAANEVYQTCGTACPATCSTKDAIRPCIAMCVQGCFCEDGYVRDDDTDACVRSEDCPAEQTTTTTTTTTMATTTTTTSSTGSD